MLFKQVSGLCRDNHTSMTPWTGDQFQENLGSPKLKMAGSHDERSLAHKVTSGGGSPGSRNTWIKRGTNWLHRKSLNCHPDTEIEGC